jgi:hypothetical protein
MQQIFTELYDALSGTVSSTKDIAENKTDKAFLPSQE